MGIDDAYNVVGGINLYGKLYDPNIANIWYTKFNLICLIQLFVKNNRKLWMNNKKFTCLSALSVLFIFFHFLEFSLASISSTISSVLLPISLLPFLLLLIVLSVVVLLFKFRLSNEFAYILFFTWIDGLIRYPLLPVLIYSSSNRILFRFLSFYWYDDYSLRCFR